MNLLFDLPLLAAGEVWEMVIGAIFFILWIVGQLVGNRNEAKQKPKPRRPKPPQPQVGEAVPVAPGPPKQEDALRSEVEDFLRRAQGKPPQEQKPPRREQAQPRPQPARLVTPEKPVRPAQRKPAVRPQTTTVAVGGAAAMDMRKEGVAEHVAKHLSTQDIKDQAEQLGDDVALADDRLETHLHEKFDHQLGSLQHRESKSQVSKRSDVAADIADMLSRPEGMRQLIVANEILRRPEW